jgi:hypothetical protein
VHTAIAATLVVAAIAAGLGAYVNVGRVLRTESAIGVLGFAVSAITAAWFLFAAWWSFVRL